jgi:hypothetical protein
MTANASTTAIKQATTELYEPLRTRRQRATNLIPAGSLVVGVTVAGDNDDYGSDKF